MAFNYKDIVNKLYESQAEEERKRLEQEEKERLETEQREKEEQEKAQRINDLKIKQNKILQNNQFDSLDDLYEVENQFHNSEIQFLLSEQLFKNGNNNDAIDWAIKSANQGNVNAQCKLGDVYYNGIDVTKDLKEAKNWYQKAADQGNQYASTKLEACIKDMESIDICDVPEYIKNLKSGNYSIIIKGNNINFSQLRKSLRENENIKINITLPDSVKKIDDRAFYECRNLTNIIMPESVTEIGIDAFAGCSNLTNVIIPNSVTKIADGAFASCSNLTNIIIPNFVTEIGECTFQFCYKLINITIPDSVKIIGKHAFNRCDSLKEVSIPKKCKLEGLKLTYSYPFDDYTKVLRR